MAIEFNCPHCAGALRAPDNQTGRPVPCPHCTQSVIVPALPVPAIEFLCPHCSATIRVRGTAIGSRGTCPACQGSVQVPAPGAFPAEREPFSAISPSDKSGFVGATLKRRRKSRSFVYVLPLVLVVILTFGGLFFLFKPEPPLTGALKGEQVDVQELGPFVIDRSYCTVPDDQFEAIREFLSTSPLRARSQLLRVEFQGMKKGIGVSIHTGDETEFVRVDPTESERLQKFVAGHLEAYEARRREALEAAVPEFLVAIDRRRNEGQEIDRMLDYRNRVGLATAVGGFGFVVAARHQGALYPCVHQDRQGVLYFSLPRRAREFELVGQQPPSTRDPPAFPGQFVVKVSRKRGAGPTGSRKPEKRQESSTPEGPESETGIDEGASRPD